MTRQSAARRGEDNTTVAREERKDAGSRCERCDDIATRGAARRAHHGRRGGAAGAVTVVEVVHDVLALKELDARALCAGERRGAGGGRQTRRGDGQQGEVLK